MASIGLPAPDVYDFL